MTGTRRQETTSWAHRWKSTTSMWRAGIQHFGPNTEKASNYNWQKQLRKEVRFSAFKALSLCSWPLRLKGWVMRSKAKSQACLRGYWMNDRVGDMGERKRWREREKVRKREIWRRCHLISPPAGSPSCCSRSLSQSLLIVTHPSNHPKPLVPPLPLLPHSLYAPFPCSLSSSSSLPLFLHPHKWLSETGQVLQNSPCSSTCLIQGLAHCTKTSNTLPTHWERSTHTHTRSHTHSYTHTLIHTGSPPTHYEYKSIKCQQY